MGSKEKNKTLSIVIPVYNSKNSIEKLVDNLILSLDKLYPLEIILVNDRSSDNSEELCIGLHEKYRNIVSFFSLSRNVGEHNAVMAGLNQTKHEYVVIMDDDFQNPVTEVAKLVEFAYMNDYDVVYSFYDQKKHSLFRNIGSSFHNRVANIMLRKPKNLYLSSFKALNRFIVKEIIKYTDPFPYVDGLIFRVTSNIGMVKVEHHKRKTGRSGYTFRKLVKLWLNMFLNFSILPLRLSIIFGFIFSGIGFIIGVLTAIEKLNNPELPVGYTFTIIVISIYSGIMLISIIDFVTGIYFSCT